MTAQQGHFERADDDQLRVLQADADSSPSWSSPPTDVVERDWRIGYAAAMADFAGRLGFILDRRPALDPVAELVAEALDATYWATAAIPNPEAVREVIRDRAAAVRRDGAR